MTFDRSHPIVQELTQARRKSELSVLELAVRSGLSESLIQKLECGHRTPKLDSLLAWADVLGYELTVRKKIGHSMFYERG